MRKNEESRASLSSTQITFPPTADARRRERAQLWRPLPRERGSRPRSRRSPSTECSSSSPPPRKSRSMDPYWASFGQGDSVPGNAAFGAYNSNIPAGFHINLVDDNNIEPASLDSPPVTDERRGGKKKVKRDKNFSHHEDELICSAYANISKDAVTGINQTSGGYWKRVYDYFHANKNFESERSQMAIQKRWEKIQKDTSKFCGYKNQMDRRNESGKGDRDRINDALKLFNDLEGHQFQFLHCWMLLRNKRKWLDYLEGNTGDRPEPCRGASSQGHTGGSTQPVDVDSVGEGSDPLSRPIGRDAAKKRRASMSGASSSSSSAINVLERMTDNLQIEWLKRDGQLAELLAREDKKLQLREREIVVRERQTVVQERLSLVQERHMLALERAEEGRIMSIDVEKVPEWQREYYIAQQQEIVNKRRCQPGDGGA